MNDINLYEKLPDKNFPLLLLPDNDPFHFPLHWHEHTEIHYMAEGENNLRCGEKVYNVKKGEIFIINGNELHEGMGGSGLDYRILLHPSFFENNYVVFKRQITDSYLEELIKDIFRQNEQLNSITALTIKGQIYMLISHLLKNYTHQSFAENTYKLYSGKLDKINTAVFYIREHYLERITTSSLSKMVHLAEPYFCRVFKDVVGATPMEYILSLRIEKAEWLLKHTDMSVTEIAFCCGFSDSNYFARAFKKNTGITPTQYSKQ